MGRRSAFALVPALVLAAVGVAAGASRTAPPTVGTTYPIAPYADARHLLAQPDGPNLSGYAQPWRGYLETRSARALAAGVGLNYNLPADADHDAVVGLLAGVGVRHLRREVPFSAVDADGRLHPHEAATLAAFLGAVRRHGVRPLILLNAHAGAPGPSTSTTRRLAAAAPAGARTLVLDDVSGLVPGRSGLSNLTEYLMGEVLFSAVDPLTRTVALARPLPMALPAGERRVDTLRYAPLHPVGTPAFEASATGWLGYARAVLDTVAAHGVADFDVEVWNELSFASHWLEATRYYEPPLPTGPLPNFLHPGGTAWELARRTTDLVKSRAPGARVIWGFSNTAFLHTPTTALPARTDGESYHPYGTGTEQYPTGLPTGDGARWEHDARPTVRKLMPEGWAHLGTRHEQLPRPRLAPGVRDVGPPGTTRFLHYMTEHGIAPREIGVADEARAQQLKAAVALRAFGFWLNKGVDVMDLYAAHDVDPAGMGMLRSDLPPSAYAETPVEELLTPQLRALAGFTAPLAGATAAAPRQLTVAASSYGPQPEVFPARDGRPALPYREMLTLLPFQVTGSKFVVGAYVMSYDLAAPPPPMSFRLTLGNLPFAGGRVSLLDPATGATTAVAAYPGAAGELVADVSLDHRFRWLVVEGPGPAPRRATAARELRTVRRAVEPASVEAAATVRPTPAGAPTTAAPRERAVLTTQDRAGRAARLSRPTPALAAPPPSLAARRPVGKARCLDA